MEWTSEPPRTNPEPDRNAPRPETSCIHCGGASSVPVLVSAEELHLVRCSQCGLVFLNDWPARTDLSVYDYYQARIEWTDSDLYLNLNQDRLRGVLERLALEAPGKCLLDVGCGEGLLVRVAADAGWDAEGIEMSEPAVRICQQRGLTATVTDFFSDVLDDRSYSVITMIELIEHVPHPGRFLARAESLLAPGGVLYVTTPNFASLGRRILGGNWTGLSPMHLSYFTPGTLRRVIADATDLEVRRMETRNVSATAIGHLLGRRVWKSDVELPAIAQLSQQGTDEQTLRHRIEGSPVLRTGKRVVNTGLRMAGAGDQMTALLKKRG